MKRTDYGTLFTEFLEQNATSLYEDFLSGKFTRTRKTKPAFEYVENDFRKHVRAFHPPASWPKLAIERRIKDDVDEQLPRGNMDYLFVTDEFDSSPVFDNVLATCEVKGPMRPILLEREGIKNFYDELSLDIKKQRARAKRACIPNYIGLLQVRSKKVLTIENLRRIVKKIASEVGGIQLQEVSLRHLHDADGLAVAVFRINAV